jgi:hypothetical protein
MAQLAYSKSSIPLWNGADGSVDVSVNVSDPTKPLDPAAGSPIVKTSFDLSANTNATFGSAGTLQLGFTADTHLQLAPLWHGQPAAAADLDKEFGISAGLDDQTVALALDVGGKADLSAAGSFQYNILTVGATVNAGTDARFVCARSYPRTESLLDILEHFFSHLALPGTLLAAPQKGELYSLELGGYLKLGVNASAGYSIKGTNDFGLGTLKLSEAYGLSVLGKLGVTAQIAGRFSVQVRAGAIDGWANVQVFRKRATDLQFAADVNVTASSKLSGLPASGKEFVGALVGVNAKNWLNLVFSAVDKAGQLPSVDALKQKLDGLADIYISKYANQAIGAVLDGTPAAAQLLGRLQKVVDSYQKLDSSAITLFDRYFDAGTQKADQLVAALGKISNLASLKDFEGEVDPVVWNVFQQLTGGDPLTAILQDSVTAVQKKVDDTLALVKDDAHAEIRNFIAVAKSQLGLDPLIDQIAKFDSVDKLKAQASDEVQHFVQRLTGQVFDKIPTKQLQPVFDMAKKISDGTAAFWKYFDDALAAASSQSYSLDLNAAWDRSDETTALIDVEINLNDSRGRAFLKSAGAGDFTDILANYNPQLVRLNKGNLTHNLQSSQGVKINIVGWHLDYQYENSFKVLTQADQQIQPTAGGGLNVFTTIDMQAQKKRRRKTTKAEEQLNTNFTLRLIAETSNIIDGSKFDKEHQQYLIDVVTGADASYLMSFTDTNTTPDKLDEALDFARVVGLDRVGATVPALKPILPKGDSYGAIDAEYRVMFTKAGLKDLFSTTFDDQSIRKILKPIVLANYYRHPTLSVVGWMYVNDSVKKVYDGDPINFVNSTSVLSDALPSLHPESPIPGIPPQVHVDISIDKTNRTLVDSLYRVEASLIDAFLHLQSLAQSAQPGSEISTDDLTKAEDKFGKVLNSFDQSTLGDNTTFAVIDGLIQMADPAEQTRASALDLTTHMDGVERHTIFQLQAK